MKTVLVVMGTRPEAIKLCPVVLELRKREEVRTFVLSTGQHGKLLTDAMACFGISADETLPPPPAQTGAAAVMGHLLGTLDAALERLRPTLIVLQSDAPDAQALHRCAELAETAEAVFLLLVRQEAYGAAWRTLQKHGVCVMTWPMEQAVLTQTLRNLLLLKKSMQTMQAQTDQLRSQLQDLKRIQKAKGLLMRQLGMTEQDAHRWIEKAAMDRCVKKREIAETIIRMYEL